jgi:hypothetical protein
LSDVCDEERHVEAVGLELPILALNRGFGNVARRQTSALR